MLNLKNKVDLICVSSVHINESILSMKKSMAVADFNECIFFTSEDVDIEHDGIKIFKIPKKNNLLEVSHFLLKEIAIYLQDNDGHYLLVQHDSWIVNPDTWTDEFLEYDYIGAPFVCHLPLIQGNGGFSLRSKKMSKFIMFNKNFNMIDEDDINICYHHRKLLEENDFKFASIKLAAKFSVEGRPITNQFGFHGSDIMIKGVGNYKKDGEIYLQDNYFSLNPKTGNIKVFPIPTEEYPHAWAYQVHITDIDSYLRYDRNELIKLVETKNCSISWKEETKEEYLAKRKELEKRNKGKE